MFRVPRTPRVIAVCALLLGLMALPATATAGDRDRSNRGHRSVAVYKAPLLPIPHAASEDGGSHVRGHALLVRRGRRLTVTVVARGLSRKLVHAQHIHGIGMSSCPGPDRRDGLVDDGLISTLEAADDYGAVQTSLTTRGDASPASALAVDRFPVARRSGVVIYRRTFTVGKDIPRSVVRRLDRHHIVLHGIDIDHSGGYDFGAGVSSLDPNLPLEATIPAACGEIRRLR